MSRILSAIRKRDIIESRVFTEKEMRGLSKSEKEFIRKNNYSIVCKQNYGLLCEHGTFYMFIAKNRQGKKQLYSITKKQSIRPNGQDICKGAYNYECWLTFGCQDGRSAFNTLEFERRFCPTFDHSLLIFA